jgi:hypothetical protein
VFSLLVLTGVVALVSGIGGFGFDGAVWWRSLLVSVGWPMLLLGAVGLVVTLREGRVRTRS